MKEARTHGRLELLSQAHRTLFERHPHAVLVIDAAGQTQTANVAAQWLSRDGRLPTVAELTRAVPAAALRRSLVDRCEWSGPLTATAADGSQRPVEAHLIPLPRGRGEAPCFLLILERVAAAQQAFDLSQDSSRRFRIVADAVPAMMWMAGDDGNFDWFNQPWMSYTGRELDQLQGERWLAAVHPDDQLRCASSFATNFEARQPFEREFRLCRHDGEYRWVSDSCVPRHAADGSFEGYIGSCVDVHERKLLETRLAENTQLLRLEDRHQGEFLGMLSHELRNPLAPMANVAKVLRLLEDEHPTLGRLQEILERQVGRLRRLVDDLVDVTQVMQGQITLSKERVMLKDLMLAAAKDIQPQLDGSGHTLQLNLPPAQHVVEGDAPRLAQMLCKLIGNTAKFASAPSVIAVSARRVRRVAQVTVKVEFLPRVFDWLSQEDPSMSHPHGGLGLDLALAKRIAQLHGGDVAAFSPGSGGNAEFVVSLPLASPSLASSTDAIEAMGLERLPALRVLIIEDNPDARYLLRLQMEMWGHAVVTVADAAHALQACDSFKPQIVLCDLGLPVTDGFQLIQPLREKLSAHTTLFAALTGYGRQEDEPRARAAGFDAFLVKPLQPGSLGALFKAYAKRAT